MKVFIRTFGCQMNEHDARRILDALGPDARSVSDPGEADLVIVNTCSVREKPYRKLYSELGRLQPLVGGTRRLLAVTGCVAVQDGARILEAVPEVGLVFGPDALPDLPGLVERAFEGERISTTPFSDRYTFDPSEWHGNLVQPGAGTAFVPIIKGCNNYCAYCIVPFVRGPEVSRDPEEVVAEVARIAEAGGVEVTLLGQNVNSYGRDLPGGRPGFAELVQSICRTPGIRRVRFVTSHPKDFGEETIDLFATEEKVCPYLHLPLQSGSDRVLERMGRGYTLADYLDRIDRLRQRVPEIALSGDIIVGFPGETAADFEQTLEAVRATGYASLYSFKYSPRPGTRAASLPDDVPASEKQRRLAELQAMQSEITLAGLRSRVGRRETVLVEGPSRRADGDLSGRSARNTVVNFRPRRPGVAPGRIVRVRIVRANRNSLWGEEEPG